MAHFDVFNGDADGICSLHQLRLAHPREATLVTGVKRDIALLERVPAQRGDSVTVLDISIDANRAPLMALLEGGVSVHYFDHHGSGNVPVHPALESRIDNAPEVCTGILVDRWLNGAHRPWAIVAAFGDNLASAAARLARQAGLSTPQVAVLQELGDCINYNAYGDSEADLTMPPAALYALLHRHPDPFSFVATEAVFQRLREVRREDLDMARQVPPYAVLDCGKIVLLPDALWSRRVCGPYANLLTLRQPEHAHAVLAPDTHGSYTVSVRAPLADLHGADRLCRMFPGGGGRPAAAGINRLPQQNLNAFTRAFEETFGAGSG